MSEEQSAVNSNEVKENDEQSVAQSGKQRKNNTTNRQQTTNGNLSAIENNGPSQESTKQENPFSFKHFLRDSAATTAAAAATGGNNNQCHSNSSSMSSPNSSNNICHSRSTSIINGSESQTPSKSATTSSLNQNHNTGARPKIPQFQSVHALGSGGGAGAESKMKRSPRFPSFDSQSSLSELSDDRSNLLHSCSNSSFNSEHPVQRSFSNYDIESPTKSPKYKSNHTSSQSANLRGFVTTNRVGAAEFSAALPDFVQDHIVMEQWYHGLGGSPKSNSPVSVDFENLPDFTINNLDDNVGRGSRPPLDGADSHSHSRNRTPARNVSPIVPFDLPTNRNNEMEYGRREQAPPDLPPDVTEGQRGAFGYGGGGGGADINRDQSTDKIQTLPDFLSDGPIHSSSRLADVTQDTPHFNSPDESANTVTIARLQSENDLLSRELDDSRQIIINQTCRISELEHLLLEARQNSILTAEFNSERVGVQDGGKRDFSSNSLTNKLKQQVKKLQNELELLRRENESLKEEGAVGGASHVRNRNRYSRTHQVSQELRLAAASAENNLRQLLTGVDNLRIMAANLENMDRLSGDPIDDYLSDDDDNDFAGPAL